MLNIKYLLFFLSLSSIIGCTDETDLSSTGTPVVSAYLYNGQAIDSLRVTLSLPYNGGGELQYLDNLEIMIVGPETSKTLSPIGDGYYSSDDFVFVGDSEYDLSFNYQGETITAHTFVPSHRAATISDSEIERTKVEVGGGFGGGFGNQDIDNIEVAWSNPEGDYYFVLVEHIDPDVELINERFAARPPRLFRSEPEVTNVHLINGLRDIQYFGRHRVIVYRLNPEYAALYETIGSSSLSIESPPNNIENGLGIFTGISTDTLYFEVIKI